MTDHTAEPWEIGDDPVDILKPSGAFIATTLAPSSSVGSAIDYANARRIVACVNACQGLSTAALETAGETPVLNLILEALRTNKYNRQACAGEGPLFEAVRALNEDPAT